METKTKNEVISEIDEILNQMNVDSIMWFLEVMKSYNKMTRAI